VLGKRDRPENSEIDALTAESKQKKRKKVSPSITKFTKEQKEDAAADEMLQKYLVTPKVKFDNLGGLSSEIKQL
jgi:SpoVK/Ycf46/Vps4 family AAA+-type ATPase